MVHRTRRGSRGPRHARVLVAPLTLLAALAAVAWFLPGALRAQPPQGSPAATVGTTQDAAQQRVLERIRAQQPAPVSQIGAPQPLPGTPGQPPQPDPGSQIEPPPGSRPVPPGEGPPVIFDGPQPPQFVPTPVVIDPKTPVKDLLPTPPKARTASHHGPAADLASVPEIDFQAAPAKNIQQAEAAQNAAHMLAAINFLNGKKTDGFLLALRGDRADLDGLPFAMGDACRTRGERNRQFTIAVALVRQALQGAVAQPDVKTGLPGGDRDHADFFWQQFATLCQQQDVGASEIDRGRQEAVTLARVAALMQILAPESPDLRLGLVKHLSGVPYAEATRALARLAVFSPEDEIRQAALDALQVRRERDYTDVLVQGLHYPWPSVARHSAEAVAKLGRNDLAPQLVALLDDPDPRAPASQEIDGKPALVVRELVRVNHARNCLLCHSPGNSEGVSADTLKAPIPLPTEPLGSPANGYQASIPDLLARIDVTYLRQDFSLLQPVEDPSPWPEMQRFDFLVRTRTVSDAEAADFREALDKREPGRPSAYQAAALRALRDLTGKDAAPTAEAWRKVLDVQR